MSQLYNDYFVNDRKIKDYEKYERTIKTIHKRFKTYGYERIKTPTFEVYDLYADVKSAINRKEMIKLIDADGEVLVLRPDVTIPITKQLAERHTTLTEEVKYFYVQDVFRQTQIEEDHIESTQAGVEYFCESSPEKDAEVIALACHTLKDLGFQNITIEIGHAAFFQSLLEKIKVNNHQLTKLKSYIHSKNIAELEPFLQSLNIDHSLMKAFLEIPMLYGNPLQVIDRAKQLISNEKIDETLNYLLEVYQILEIYGLSQYVVMDLGLINHMGYYSDIIFQGFVEKFGRPVLMGGRYNRLSHEFGANLPAIGFACTVESLLEAKKVERPSQKTPIDVFIEYDSENLKEAIGLANELRERNYIVLSAENKEALSRKVIYSVELKGNQSLFTYKDKSIAFNAFTELLLLIRESKGGI